MQRAGDQKVLQTRQMLISCHSDPAVAGEESSGSRVIEDSSHCCFAPLIPIALSFYAVVIARCAKRAVAIHLDCFVASLLAMTVYFHRAIGISRPPMGILTKSARNSCPQNPTKPRHVSEYHQGVELTAFLPPRRLQIFSLWQVGGNPLHAKTMKSRCHMPTGPFRGPA